MTIKYNPTPPIDLEETQQSLPHHPRLPTIPSTTPYWRTQPSPVDTYLSSLTVPPIVDIAIIGSGLAGACTAYQLTQLSPTLAPNIAIFEARQACSGATGRNGGHTKIPPRSIAQFSSKYGAEKALEFALYWKELHGAFKACAESVVVDEEGKTLMEECEMLVTRSFDVFLDEEHAIEMEREWKKCLRGMREVARKRGIESELEWLDGMQFIKGDFVEKVTSVRGAKAAFSCPAMSLWPYKFVCGLLQHVINLGVKLYTITPVVKMLRISDGNPATPDTTGLTALYTPRGVTLARKVIFASNGYVSNLLPQYEKTVTPIRGTACHIIRQPKAPEQTQLVNTYNVHNSASSVEYFVPRPDGSFILGGGQILYRTDKEKWYDMIDDNTVIPGVKEKWFDGYIGDHFRGWNKDGEDEDIDYTWTGIMGYTEDSFPHVGLVPGQEDHFILAGFNGSGMSYIFLVAKAIARMAQEGISYEETGLPAVFKTVPGRIKPY